MDKSVHNKELTKIGESNPDDDVSEGKVSKRSDSDCETNRRHKPNNYQSDSSSSSSSSSSPSNTGSK